MSESNIELFPNQDLDPDAMFEKCKGQFEEAFVMGYTPEGEERFISSKSDGPETLWMLERFKHALMRVADGDD
jgi:hypothetical protein